MNILIFSATTREDDGKFISGEYEVEFPTRKLMLITLGKLVRRGINVSIKS